MSTCPAEGLEGEGSIDELEKHRKHGVDQDFWRAKPA